MQRTQIYLDEAQTTDLDERARRSGRTRSDLIREAISTFLQRDDRSEAELVVWQEEGILGAFGVEADIAESVAELRAANRRRLPELDVRWDAPK